VTCDQSDSPSSRDDRLGFSVASFASDEDEASSVDDDAAMHRLDLAKNFVPRTRGTPRAKRRAAMPQPGAARRALALAWLELRSSEDVVALGETRLFVHAVHAAGANAEPVMHVHPMTTAD
jgi:hypothetical protein